MYIEIPYKDPAELFSPFSKMPGSVLLHSARQMPECGQYSFIGIDPFLILQSKNHDIFLNEKKCNGNPFDILARELQRFRLKTEPLLPPFQGGVMGFFSYDLYRHLENIAADQVDDMQFPDMAVGFYDLVISIDHQLQRAWIFSQGFPEVEKERQDKRAKERVIWLKSQLEKKKENEIINETEIKIISDFTKTKYCAAVETVKDYILAGDIFEANISQRFHATLPGDFSSYALYLALQSHNPAPFSSYMVFSDTVIASVSPERFLKLTDRKIETRPIKGTRPRGKTREHDEALSKALCESEKDIAENVMIVDLLRNDLSRVCDPHSVIVPKLCGLESYAHVHHLVSIVHGNLSKEFNALDLLKACFPGGSITGAPKIRAMEVIAEVEPTARGPYCGCTGYIGFNGDMDTAITIRTFAIKNNKVTFQAGGAVTLESTAAEEFDESSTKADALIRVLQSVDETV